MEEIQAEENNKEVGVEKGRKEREKIERAKRRKIETCGWKGE